MKQSAIIAILLLIASMSIHMYADARMTDAEVKRQFAIASKVVDSMQQSGELLETAIKLSDTISEERFRYYIQELIRHVKRIEIYSASDMVNRIRFPLDELNELSRNLKSLMYATTKKRREIIRSKYSEHQCPVDQCNSPSNSCREFCRELNQFAYDALQYGVLGLLEERGGSGNLNKGDK